MEYGDTTKDKKLPWEVRLDEFEKLKHDWDGEDGAPPGASIPLARAFICKCIAELRRRNADESGLHVYPSNNAVDLYLGEYDYIGSIYDDGALMFNGADYTDADEAVCAVCEYIVRRNNSNRSHQRTK